ncbi:hypothetical protein T439DRAFT_384439 [Meredithblackwellia eburnea MCA 4105]
MPHTNNPNAKNRQARRHDPTKPRFLQKKPKAKESTSTNAEDVPRAQHVALIQEFHTLEKRLNATKDERERAELLKKQEELGGLQKYQEASIHGGDKKRGGESGKWCVKVIQELKVGVEIGKGKGKEAAQEVKVGADGKKVYPEKPKREKLRLLDVGAIAGSSYTSYSWINTTCIDLNPQAPHVIKADFFDFPTPASEGEKFDVVALSLVVNFIGSLKKRGDIFLHTHQYLKPGGYLYLVLPLPCLTNSRYMSHERLTSILRTTGWSVAKQHDSAKLTYWFLKRDETLKDGRVWKREEVRRGVQRNNFCIVLDPESGDEEESRKEKISKADGEDLGSEEEWGGISL